MNKNISIVSALSLDLRSLALMRIGLALIIIYDLIHRAQYLTFHYTDNGVLPVQILKTEVWKPGYWSFHSWSGSAEWQAFLFVLAGIFAFILLIGYRARLFAVLSWIMMISLHNQNPLVLNSGDAYLRMLLLIAIFLPIGRRYSVAPVRYRGQLDTYFSAATVLLIAQIMCVYIFTGLFKHSGEWLTEGSALHYALSLKQMTKPLGEWMLQFPELLRLLTFGTLLIEAFLPLFLLIPVKNHIFRYIFIAVFVLFHLGIYATMMVGLFSFVCIVALLALLPSHFYTLRTFKPEQRPVPERSLWLNTVAALLLLFIVYLNVHSLKPIHSQNSVPALLSQTLRISQNWKMFAPRVLKRDGWFAFKATRPDGTTFDAFQNDGILYFDEIPPNVMEMYKNHARWRKFLSTLYSQNNATLYKTLAHSVALNSGQPLQQIEIWFIHIRDNTIVQQEKIFE